MEKLRRTSINSGYIFCTSEIATVLKLDFYSGSVVRFKAIGIGYLVNLNHKRSFEKAPGRRSAAKLLTKDEARRIAVNIAKLPEYCARLDMSVSL